MRRCAAVVLGLVALMGCVRRAETEGQEVAAPAEYYPLSVGNRWTYDVTFLGEKREHTVELVGEREGFFVDREGTRIGVDAFGVWDGKRYLLRGPLREGQAWNNMVSVSSLERYRVLAAGVRCTAPAGAFRDCVQVEARNRVDAKTTLVNTLTFARGVGIVRVETVAEIDGRQVPQASRALASYAVKPTTR
ncbi:MAG: hypothetical protein L0Y64_16180 [Myxococcaceae bacterium]|nr:hypothetical protein [Myxococcaceae bacterium]